MKETYIMQQIRKFHSRIIPLEEYPEACRELRATINRVAELATNAVKTKYINNEITKDTYKLNISLIEHQRRNYQKQVNSI